MKPQPTPERAARRLAMYSAGMSTFMLVLVIGFGLRGGRGQIFASVALVMALAGAVMAWYSYTRYRKLRDARWQDELAQSESDMSQILSQSEANTGAETNKKSEEQPLAQP